MESTVLLISGGQREVLDEERAHGGVAAIRQHAHARERRDHGAGYTPSVPTKKIANKNHKCPYKTHPK